MNLTTMNNAAAAMVSVVNRATVESANNGIVAKITAVDGIMVGIFEVRYLQRSAENIRITAQAVPRTIL